MQKNDIIKLAYHMVDALSSLRLSRIEQQGRVERLPTHASWRPSTKHEHDLRWHGKMWVCTKCFYRTSSPLSLSSSRRFCLKADPLNAILKSDKGHMLWQATVAGGGTVIYCSRCWHYASSYPRNLLLPCQPGVLKLRPCAKFHLINRRHPVSCSRLLRPLRLHALQSVTPM